MQGSENKEAVEARRRIKKITEKNKQLLIFMNLD